MRMKYFSIRWKIWKTHTYNFQEINLQKCTKFRTKVYFVGHTFQCKILISCRDKIWPTLWCIFVHSDSMSLSLSHLLAAFSDSIFYCLLYILLLVLLVMHFCLSFCGCLCWVSYSISQIADQCFGSGSGLDPDSKKSLAPDSESVSWSRWAQMTHKNRKKLRNFMFWSAGCSLLRAEGFSYSLDVLYWGLGISKLQFSIKKILNICLAVNFFQVLIIKSLDPDWTKTKTKTIATQFPFH